MLRINVRALIDFWGSKVGAYSRVGAYLIRQKFVGQNCRNFGLVSKIFSDEKFCPSKILSNVSIQKSDKNGTKLSNFGLVSKLLSDEILYDKVP